MPNEALLILDSKNAEACRRLADSANPPASLLKRFSGSTLPGLMECFFLGARHSTMATLRKELREKIRQAEEPWRSLGQAWDRSDTTEYNVFEARQFEFKKIDSKTWGSDEENWNLFEQRFLSGLRNVGFGSEFAHSVLRVFHEMAENVTQHGNCKNGLVEGLAGYHVEPGRFSFSVGDLGRGFLRSLQESSSWSQLETSKDALKAVIYEGASRRFGQGEGEGFKQLWKALANHGALVRIRSGNSVASIRPTSTGKEVEISTIFESPGSHISVCCALGINPTESNHRFFFTRSLD